MPFHWELKVDHHTMSLRAERGMRRRVSGFLNDVAKSNRDQMNAREVGITWLVNCRKPVKKRRSPGVWF